MCATPHPGNIPLSSPASNAAATASAAGTNTPLFDHPLLPSASLSLSLLFALRRSASLCYAIACTQIRNRVHTNWARTFPAPKKKKNSKFRNHTRRSVFSFTLNNCTPAAERENHRSPRRTRSKQIRRFYKIAHAGGGGGKTESSNHGR